MKIVKKSNLIRKNEVWNSNVEYDNTSFDILIFWMLYLKWLRKGKLIWDDEIYIGLRFNEIMIYFTYVFIAYMIFLDY